jgi:hypothetical protein
VSHIRNLVALGGVSLSAVVAVTMSPALAATTTIHKGSAGGPAYSGGVTATNLGAITVTSSLVNITCASSALAGAVDSDGTDLNVTAASFKGCTGSVGSVTVTATRLPWNGGSMVYSPVAGGRDGTVTLVGFTAIATGIGVTCTYSGNLVGAAYNPDNPHRPNTSVAQAQAGINGASVSLSSGSLLCPSTARVTAAYQLTGSGGEQLWASG